MKKEDTSVHATKMFIVKRKVIIFAPAESEGTTTILQCNC